MKIHKRTRSKVLTFNKKLQMQMSAFTDFYPMEITSLLMMTMMADVDSVDICEIRDQKKMSSSPSIDRKSIAIF